MNSRSLRARLIILMSALVVLQSLALIVALVSSHVFFALDEEAFRLFDSTINARTQMLSKRIGDLMINTANEVSRINHQVDDIVSLHDATPQQIYSNPDLREQFDDLAMESILNLLRSNNITGAFIVLDKAMDQQNPDSHWALYIRNSAPDLTGEDNTQLLMNVGPVSLSQKYKVPLSVKWDTSLDFSNMEHRQFYTKPIQAAQQHPRLELTRYGYWMEPSPLLHDGNEVVTYSLPLLDNKGQAYGVLGFEISMAYMTQRYLPTTHIPYQTIFLTIASGTDAGLDLSWYIPGGPLAQLYLQKGQVLPLKPVPETNLQSASFANLGEMYCSLHTLRLHNEDSPFYGGGWHLVGFVPKEALHSTSQHARTILFGSIAIITLISFAAIFALSYLSTRKISSLSKHIQNIDNYQQEIKFKPTGLQEIDELTGAVEKLNKSVLHSAKITSKIMELTNMPMGCFEITNNNPYVTVTGYIYELLGLNQGSLISRHQWQQHYAVITAEPSPEDNHVFYYQPPDTDTKMWLRISEANTDNGQVGTIMDVTADIEAQQRLARELDYDPLTGLFSRTAFKRKAHRAIQNQPDKIGVMVFVDLDNLKHVNDTYGHDVGDQYIIRAGEVLNRYARHGGIVARISGDEFAIYLHGFHSKEQLYSLIKNQFEKNHLEVMQLPHGQKQQVRHSGGAAWYPQDADNVTDLLKLADFAMYEAKHQRKGTLVQFNKASYRKNMHLLKNSEDINELIDQGLVQFAFQPIVEVATGAIYGYEALMRPMHESFVSPLEVLEVAAAQSKLYQLEYMLSQKLIKHAYHNREQFGHKKIFINTIPNQMLSYNDFMSLQKEYGDIFPQVVVEFMESETVTAKVVQQKVAYLRQSGASIAIDDFGAGFSNELQILNLNPDIIKVDMGIIRDIETDARKQHLMENILSFSHRRNIKVVAEGVETKAELMYLKQQGVDFVQGYLLGRPELTLTQLDQSQKQLFNS